MEECDAVLCAIVRLLADRLSHGRESDASEVFERYFDRTFDAKYRTVRKSECFLKLKLLKFAAEPCAICSVYLL